MPPLRPWLSPTLLSLATLAAPLAWGAGFGSGAPGAVLGQPLDFVVQVRLETGESITPECVAAEVTAGDRRVPPALVRTAVEAQTADVVRVRVITLQGIDEPVIGVNLSVGCASRMARRYVVLADPPAIAAPPQTPAWAATPAQLPLASPAPAGAEAGVQVAAAGDVSAGAAPAVPAAVAAVVSAGLAPAPSATEAPRPRRAARAHPPAQARPAMQRAERPPAGVRRPPPAPAADTAAAAVAPSRLKLDLMEPGADGGDAVAVEQAIEAVAQAASAARAAASAASAAAERIAGLERTVADLRTQAQTSDELVVQLRQRLGQNDGASRWLLPLMVAVGLLAALTAWMAWRLTRMQQAQQRMWRGVASAVPALDPTPSRQPTAPIPFVTSEIRVPPAAPAAPRPRGVPAWPPASPPDGGPASPPVARLGQAEPTTPTRRAQLAGLAAAPDAPTQPVLSPLRAPQGERTEVLPPRPRADETVPRDVSIEELIDLEQQAEFFVVLGQDDAAIDLLVDHLRNTGGGSPLPYLKLLEIYHRRGEHEAYERMRTRFNHRFNAYAPEWGVDLHGGRSLDDYPGVVPRLQQVWSRPLDAMAELEALLFRKSRGDLFDLMAYREVLFLYSLARDLLDREAADTGNVDLLLPLSDGGDDGSTSPAPFLGLEHGAADEHKLDFDARPTSPVDFDLTAAEEPLARTSIFDRLEDTPPRRP